MIKVDTFYKDTFEKECDNEPISNEPNPEFLMRSKYGSLSKARWMKYGQGRREESLQLYK
jgi:hypothetical protein